MIKQREADLSQTRVLIIDDEGDVCTFFRRLLSRRGYAVTTAENEPEAAEALSGQLFNVALVDLKLPDTDGLTLLKKIKQQQPQCEVIIMTGYSTVKTAVTAIQLGAYEYLEKPFEDIDEIENLIDRAASYSTNLSLGQIGDEEWADVASAVGFQVGRSPAMRRMVALAHKIAGKNINVLIQGKTGTGKEVLSRFIHAASNRSGQPFLPINCGALPENLLESELFGHEKGAFTGANQTRRGIFELANRGTLFLDEIGDASPLIQVKLLRVLETGDFMRVGGEKPIRTDVRIIAATNVDLEKAIAENTFREDLYYRLNVVRLEIPTLQERREDIPQLAEFFANQFNPALKIAPATLELLSLHHWPGNIRELANTLRRAVVLCAGPVLLPEHLGETLGARQGSPVTLPEKIGLDPAGGAPVENFWSHYGSESTLEQMSAGQLQQMLHSLRGLEKSLAKVMARKGLCSEPRGGLRDTELEMIRKTLAQHRWNITEAARTLGIGRNTLHRKIKKFQLRED